MNAFPSDLNALTRLDTKLTPPARDALSRLRRLANGQGFALFLVGGGLRDLLLDRPGLDIDLAVEGDVTELARAVAAETDGRAVFHPRFGTASVRATGYSIDLARTRQETYVRPGALPTVEPALIGADLARRDFTINAMALRLTEPAGQIVDPHGGLADLGRGLIRLLHPDSFRDDGTRMLRAVRYACRLGYRIEPETEALLQRDRDYLATISGPRLRRELSLLFREQAAADATLAAHRQSLLTGIHPALGLDERVASAWRDALAGEHHASLEELGFCLIAGRAQDEEITSIATRLHLAGRIEAALRDLVRLRRLSDKLEWFRSPASAIVELLDRFTIAAVWAFACADPGAAGEAAMTYLGVWRKVRPVLRGDDILALGLEPGEKIGQALQFLRAARLEKRARTKRQEIALLTSEFGIQAAQRRGKGPSRK